MPLVGRLGHLDPFGNLVELTHPVTVLSGSTSGPPASRRSRSRLTGRWSRAPRRATRSRPRGPAGPSRIPRTGGAPPRRRSRSCPSGPIGFSGQMHGLVTLDEPSAVLRPAILWNDQRTAAECAEIEQRVGLERLIELTGNRALTGFTAPKLLWVRKHEPDVYARIRHVLLPKDYVRLRLEGVHAIDAADASGTLLYDVARRRWSEEVLAALELPGEWLPPAFESTEVAGAGDQAAGALGVGVVGPGPLRSCSGPRASSSRRSPSYAPDPQARVHAFCHAVPGTWHAMGVMLSAAGSLALAAAGGRRAPYGALDGEAAGGSRASRGCSSSRISPASGRRTPTRTRAAPSSGCSCGTTVARSPGRCSKASPTGCATRSSCCGSSASRPTSAASPAAARARGSGSDRRAVLGIPLERTAVEEGAAYGAALLARRSARASSRTRTRRSPARVRVTDGRAAREWRAPTTRATRATGGSTLRCGRCDRAPARRRSLPRLRRLSRVHDTRIRRSSSGRRPSSSPARTQTSTRPGSAGRRWGATASATGIAHANDCEPYCAAGHFHTYRVTVTLSKPKRCGGRVELTHLAWRFPAGKPAGPRARSVDFRCA